MGDCHKAEKKIRQVIAIKLRKKIRRVIAIKLGEYHKTAPLNDFP